MTSSVKWIALGIVCAILAFFLYPFIDSEWASTHNAGIWVTIGFFAAATITVLCGFNAIESRDRTLNH